jgi:Mrp family chromosome partitioning ATPase
MSMRDQVDGFILIFRMGFTPYVMLRQALEEIEKTKIIGVVLNGVERCPKRCGTAKVQILPTVLRRILP